MFQSPNGYIAQTCKVQPGTGVSTTKWWFYTVFDLIPLYTYLFSLDETENQDESTGLV